MGMMKKQLLLYFLFENTLRNKIIIKFEILVLVYLLGLLFFRLQWQPKEGGKINSYAC